MGKRRGRPFYSGRQELPRRTIADYHNDTSLVKAENIPLGKKNIGFVHDKYDCCMEKIVMEFAPYLLESGHQVLGIPINKFEDIMKYVCEKVVLFRTGVTHESGKFIKSLANYLNYIRSFGVKIFYYADDLIFTANAGAPLFLARACDAIIVATPTIKEWLQNKQNVSNPIYILPTHVDLKTFDKIKKVEIKSDKFKIFISSGGRIGAFGLLNIAEIMNEDAEYFKNFQLVINSDGVAQMRSIINKFRNINKLYFDWVPLTGYYALYKSTDLVIAPATEKDLDYLVAKELQEDWLNCKSEVKYTLAGAAGIPIIASPTKSYVDNIKHGVTGFIANSTEEFIMFTKMLYENKELYKTIGENARKDIEDRYDIKKRYNDLINILDGKVGEATSIVYKNKMLYMSSGAGGPRTFYEMMKTHIPKVNPSWNVTDVPDANITASLITAFLNAEVSLRLKELNPSIKLVHRMDGFPVSLDGSVDQPSLEIMIKTYNASDKIVWQSNHCKKFWKDHVDTSRGVIIHNGVDQSIFTPDGEKYNLAGNNIRLLNTNWSLFKHKRIDLLQKVVEAIKDDHKYEVSMVGHYVLADITSNLGMWGKYSNVHYLGPIYNYKPEGRGVLASIYRAADAVIFTSEMEGSPNTVIEAISCGTPVLYNSNSDIVPEICGEWCIPFNDENSFKEALLKLEDKDYMDNLRKNLIEVSKSYSIQGCVKKYMDVLENG